MHPTEILSQEHRAIEARLAELEIEIQTAAPAHPFPTAFFESALDFFRNFADGCHHAKEENLLFPLMKERGVPEQDGPIGVMLAEHNQGRAYLRVIRENLDAAAQGSPSAREAVYGGAAEYIDLLRAHIFKEDNIMFRLAQQVLHPDDVAELRKQFAAIEIPARFQKLGTSSAPAA
jgi:hemerythrin-like domain-containing protein